MNILSHKLNEAAQSGRFGFHPRCQESGLTHLCFADDILVFTDGSLNSIQMILQVLDEFKAFSGLSISVEKSCFFSSGLSEVEIDAITETCGIPAGTFPIRYLGLPLNTRKLSIANCEPLLHQIKSKINSWTSKYLSFAGRQVLISTVIGGITNFWSGAFILPKECISLIDKMCNAFLWKGTLEGKYVARVAWEKVATPRKNGGLGLRNLAIWNRTCIIKLLWLLLFIPESIWASWMQDNVIKDESFWELKPRLNHTWIFKRILEERQTALQWIIISPGNGRKINFWLDPWTPFGQLISFIGHQGPRLTGISRATNVADLWINGQWSFRHARSPQMEELLTYLTTVSLTDEPSNAQWIMDGAPKHTFSPSAVYNSFFEHSPIVPWHPIIWIKKGIPKHKSLAWIMLLNRSPTRDRLLSWALQTDPRCLLCNLSDKSRNHLYFECPFSIAIWSYYAARLRIPQTSNSWADVTHSLLSLTGTNDHIYLSILSWQATVYEVWWERNERLHRGKFRSVDMVVKKINGLIKNKISSLRPESNRRASSLMQIWFSIIDGSS